MGRRRRSLGAQRALGRRRRSPEELDAILAGLVDRLGRRLRAAHRLCRTVTLRFRFADFSRATRSQTLREPTAHTAVVLAAARGLLAAAGPLIDAEGLSLLGVALSNLDNDGAVQLALPFDGPDPGALDATLDQVRDKYGARAVSRAMLLGRDPGVEVPLLPD